MKLQLLTLCLLLQTAIAPVAAQSSKQKQIQQFANTPGLQHASIGFCIKDFSGNVVAQHNMDKAYTPASILKIVTVATAFEVLGATYQYKTTLAKNINNDKQILIHGYGDPTLGTEHLKNNQKEFINIWSTQIAEAFASNKEVDILIIDNHFGYQGVARKWIHEDIGNYYAASTYGISVFDNTYRLSFNTKGPNSEPEIIGTDPKMKDIEFTNTLSINTSGQDNGYILGAPLSNKRTIIGDIPANRTRFTIKGEIPNPGLFLGQVIAESISENGFKVKNINTTYTTYHNEMYAAKQTSYNENIFYTHLSPPLSDIAREVNEQSNNHYAEHLIRTIGRASNSNIYSLALEEGIKKVEDVWKINGLKTDALFMYDGCGLAPTNGVSAQFVSDVLVYMQTKSKNATAFLGSMPKAGKDGTVRNFLKGTRLEGKVYIKSGSIANVQCFAGYYIDGNKKYAFTIMVNKYDAPRNQVVKAIERLLLNTL